MKSFYTLALLLSFPFTLIFSQNISDLGFARLDLDITSNGEKINLNKPILRLDKTSQDNQRRLNYELILEFKTNAPIPIKEVPRKSEEFKKYSLFFLDKYVVEFRDKDSNETPFVELLKENIRFTQINNTLGERSNYYYYTLNLHVPIQLLLESESIDILLYELIRE